MRTYKIIRSLVTLGLALGLASVPGRSVGQPPFSPPPGAQSLSFSVAAGDPLTAFSIHPADVLGAGGLPLIPCFGLGLICTDLDTGDEDDLNSLSLGWDFLPSDLARLTFAVSPASQGAPGTAVSDEAACAPPEQSSDVFESPRTGQNFQDLDGDGLACSANGGFWLGLAESGPADQVDALDRDACAYVDWNCDGIPEAPVFLTLKPGSPTLGVVGADPADILLTANGFTPVVWAAGVADLGLAPGDVIDALCVRENGDGVYDSGDQVLFSLAPGSPTLAALSAGPADVLRPAPPAVVFPAAALGLRPTDDLTALTCAYTCYDFNANRQVDVQDLQAMAARFHRSAANPDPDGNPATPNYDPQYDIDDDQVITIVDIMQVAAQWDMLCP